MIHPRVFVALRLPEEVRAALSRVRRRLESVGARVGWVNEADFHLTLAFIGDLEADEVAVLGAALDEALRGIAPFRMEIIGTGWFGSRGAPRVLWAGVAGPPAELLALHDRVADALRRRKFPVEERAFRPHITLGRVRSVQRAAALTAAMASFMNASFGTALAESVSLMAGSASPGVPRYRVLHNTILKG